MPANSKSEFNISEFETGYLSPGEIVIPGFITVFSYPVSGQNLFNSVRENGIISPVIVVKAESGKYSVVCGVKRILAAKELGMENIPCLILSAGCLQDKELFDIAFAENCSVRSMNIVETGGILSVLAGRFGQSRESISKNYISRLNENEGLRNIDNFIAVSKYSEKLKNFLVRWNVNISTAGLLNKFSDEGREKLFSVFEKLQVHGGKLKQFITFSFEVCKKDGLPVEQLFAENDAQRIFSNEKITLSQKQAKILEWLRMRKYPKLTEQYAAFEKKAAELEKLPAGTIKPPKNFEGDKLEVILNFKSIDELNTLSSALTNEKNRTKIQDLFDIL